MKRIPIQCFSLLFITLVLLALPAVAPAETYNETFSTTTYRDGANTTALWNTSTGTISLNPFEITQIGLNGATYTQGRTKIVGDYAYVTALNYGLRVIDISNPVIPVPVGVYDPDGHVRDVVIEGNFAYVAAGTDGFKVLDITVPANPTLACDSVFFVGDVWGIDVSGNYAYVASTDYGIIAFDISDPHAPLQMGSYNDPPGGAAETKIMIQGDYAYVANGTLGLTVLDISVPGSPALAGGYSPGGNIITLAVSGNYAYLVDYFSGVKIVSIVDPTNPVEVSHYDFLDRTSDISISGQYAYVTNYNNTISSNTDHGVKVLDISDPVNPVLVDSFNTPRISFGVTADGNYGYLTDDNAFKILRIAGLVPSPVRGGDGGPGGVGMDAPQEICIDGHYAYVAWGQAGFSVVDVSNPAASPLPVAGHLDWPDDARDVAVAGNYAYVTDTYKGLLVIDISSPFAPALAGTTLVTGIMGRGIAVAGNYAYVGAYGRGLYVFDISDPHLPTQAGFYAMDFIEDVAVSGDYVYFTGESYGLIIVDVSNPAAPTLVTSIDTGTAHNVTLIGDLAYVDGSIVDITDPANPAIVGSTGVSGEIVIAGEYGYVAAGGSGLQILDMSNPTSPTVAAGYTNFMGVAYTVAVSGDYAFIDDGTQLAAVQVLDRNMDLTGMTVQSVRINGVTDETVMDVGLSVGQTGTINWEVSADGGVHWENIMPGGGTQPVINFGNDLRWRASLLYEQAGVYPSCSSLQLDWIQYDLTATEPTITVYFDAAHTQQDTCWMGPYIPFTAYVTAQGFAEPLVGVEFMLDRGVFPSGDLILMSETLPDPGWLKIGSAETGCAIAFPEPVNALAPVTVLEVMYLPLTACTSCDTRDKPFNILPNPDSGYLAGYVAWNPINERIPATGVPAYTCYTYTDSDNDGVEDGSDACPYVSGGYFDRDGDGCVDQIVSSRHVEYWSVEDTVWYYISGGGAPNIGDGSDINALTEAMDTWPALAGSNIPALYGGEVPLDLASPFDGVNLITFKDPVMNDEKGTYFSDAVIAVGITTSFTEATYYDDKWYRPGEILDSDMLFNPAKTFVTSTGIGGIDLKSVAVHEAGHLYGLSHSAMRTSTMYPILGSGTETASLTVEDSLQFVKAYPAPYALAGANLLQGTVEAYDGDPVPGAVVFAIDAGSGDTTACEYTMEDGSYSFLLPNGTYHLSIHPMDGSAAVGYLEPAAVNWLINSWGRHDFVPEYWDTGESEADDPGAVSDIALYSPGSATVANFITNVDLVPPVVTQTTPPQGAPDVRVDATVIIEFDEVIDFNSLQGNFRLVNLGTGQGVGGNASLIEDGTLLTFSPWNLLDYSAAYACSLKTGLADRFGNSLAAPVVFTFNTETPPPLALTSLVPDKGVTGSVIVLNGAGFDTTASNNAILFADAAGTGTVEADVVSATKHQLVASVPAGAGTGDVTVLVGPSTSEPRTFTLLSQQKVVRGYEVGNCDLSAFPRSHALLPDGSTAFIATPEGLSIVGVDPGAADFCVETTIPITGGLDDVAVTPDGSWVYGVCACESALDVIDPVTQTVPFVLDTGTEPVSITIDQTGRRAYIPVAGGSIQKWDIEEGSPTFRQQIGTIVSPDPNLRSNIAVDPTGELLLALSGTGKILAFATATGEFKGSVPIGPDPRDIVVDPTGLRAYVSDGSGEVTIVALRSNVTEPVNPFKVHSIKTGGSLRKATISPAGNYLYSANRQLNLIDVIDLNPNASTYRTVVATIPQGINPVEVNLSPAGEYAYSLVEDEMKMVVLGVGVGPAVESVSPPAGPAGTRIVLGGSDLGAAVDTVRVLFGDRNADPVIVQPDWVSGSALGVTVPGGVPPGPVSVRTGTTKYSYSNVLYFETLEPTPPPGQLRLVSRTGLQPLDVVPVSALSPAGDQTIIGTASGNLLFVDTDPNSATFNQIIHTTSLGFPAVYDIAITPDGRRAYVTFEGEPLVYLFDCNRSSSTYGTQLGSVQQWAPYPMTDSRELAISPDGRWCLVHDDRPSWGRIYRVDIDPGSPTYNTALDTIAANRSLSARDITYHPGGRQAYLSLSGIVAIAEVYGPGAQVTGAVTVIGPTLFPNDPKTLSFTPDGQRCYVLAEEPGMAYANMFEIDTSDPLNPLVPDMGGTNPVSFGIWPPVRGDNIDISPRGDRAFVHVGSTVYNFDLMDFLNDPGRIVNQFDSPVHAGPMDQDFTPDGTRAYAVSASTDSLLVYDFSGADNLALVSGDGQTGIAGMPLRAPLRVRVTSGGQPSVGVAITFRIVSGGGRFVRSNSEMQIVATDAMGYAQVEWNLGTDIGVQSASASADGLAGSPVQFDATAIENPAILPLEFAGMRPVDGAQNVGITTTVIAAFSRGVNPASVGTSNFFLHKSNDSQPVPATIGFSDENRKVSLTPAAPLDVSTSYTVEIGATIQDNSGGNLVSGIVSQFTTVPPPPLRLASVNPPSSARQVMIVLAGTGFSPVAAENAVLFNDVAATPVESGIDYCKVVVPAHAQSGTIRVQVGAQVSGTLPFTVLEPLQTTSDETIAEVGTHSATKSLVINPAGSWAYGISPEANVMVPVDIVNRTSLGGVAVGNHPISVALNPEGTFLYVANFQSGSISIINIDEDSPEFLEPDTTLTVGNYPIDLTVNPEGDRIYVVNAGADPDQNIDVIDSDIESANFHSVLATLGTGASTRSVVMTPDGSRLYFGTDTGFIVMDAADYGVLATVGTGAATKSVIMHPDGGLLFILTTEGDLMIVDILPNSTRENTVLATLGTGSSTRSVTMSPDGSRLYLIQEELDAIVVVQLTIIGSATVIDPDDQIPPVQISFSFIDTIDAGEDPEMIVFDPAGSDLALVANSGPETITFLSAEAPMPDTLVAGIEVTPRTLSLKSRGRYIHGTIVPDPAYSVHDIDIASILLQDTIPAILEKSFIADVDSNGIDELITAFDRPLFQSIMPQGEYVPVRISGMILDVPFIGEDTIRTIRPTVHKPNGGVLPLNSPTLVRWTSPEGYSIDAVDVFWSPDDGENWLPIAEGIPDAGSVGWLTPATELDSCRVMVTIYRNGEDLGMGMNQIPFVVANPVAIAITGFEGSVEAGAAVLRWTTGAPGDITGFHLLRAEKRDAVYERITEEPVPVAGVRPGQAYVYRDSTVLLNQRYYYKLEQISERGTEGITGPYMMIVRAELSLEQNVPNPFNPTTTITYTIPGKMAVKLAIYDVQGRLVKTLVDERQSQGFKKALWDGRDGKGNPVASGVYFYRLRAGKKVLTKKMVLLK